MTDWPFVLMLGALALAVLAMVFDHAFLALQAATVTVVSKRHIAPDVDPTAGSVKLDAMLGYGEPQIVPERFRITVQGPDGNESHIDVPEADFGEYGIGDRAVLLFRRGRLTRSCYPARLSPLGEGAADPMRTTA